MSKLALMALVMMSALVPMPLWAQSIPPEVQESTFWAQEVDNGNMPPIEQRLPKQPLVVDLEAKGRSFGTQGGTLRTFMRDW